ncbi:cytosolic phospholipase A2 gamma isoform X2 [Anolis carolinensis]
MYLCAVSGSTWCLSSLSKDKDWTEKIEILEKRDCKNLAQGTWKFEKASQALLESIENECYSLTEIWSYFLVHKMLKQLDETGLPAHAASCENGKNPYPIFPAVDKETYLTHNEATWYEFTPHEVGIPGLGAYVDTKYFGSFFENGELIKEKKERNICYLQGLWGSACASNEALLNFITGALGDFLKQNRSEASSSVNIDEDDQKLNKLFKGYQSILELKLSKGTEANKQFDLLETILGGFSKSCELLKSIRQTWISAASERKKEQCINLSQAMDEDYGGFAKDSNKVLYNVMRKTFLCLLNWTWGTTYNFLYHCSDVEFSELSSKQVLELIDAGLTINTAYPSALRPEREVKLIISFDYSAQDPFMTIKLASEFCKAHGIPFPEINERELEDTDNPSDCYIFRGEQAPTVIHCPLFNNVNCPGKIAEYREEFSTFNLSYSSEEIEKLLTAAKKNVANVREKILEEIKHIIDTSSQKA